MNSIAYRAELACPQCAQPLTADVWYVVDVDERPDLVERIVHGDLHAATCPFCAWEGVLDIPILLFLLHANGNGALPPLIFSPAQQRSDDLTRQDAAYLVDLLAQHLGDGWQDEWMQRSISVPRDRLRAVLSELQKGSAQAHEGEQGDNPQLSPAVAVALQAVLTALAEEGLTVDSPETLAAALAERPALQAQLDLAAVLDYFLSLATWDDMQQAVEQYRVLLSDDADSLLVELAGVYAEETEIVAMLAQRRSLLQRCREVGIARAFAEQMLASDELAEAVLMDETVEVTGSHRTQSELGEVLRTALEEEQCFQSTGDLDALKRATIAWEQILRLSDFADASAPIRAVVHGGAGAIYLRRYQVVGRTADLNRALDLMEEAVNLIPEDSPDRAMYLASLGLALGDRYALARRPEDLDEAIRVYRQAVSLTREDSPDRAALLGSLGLALGDRYALARRPEDLDEAIQVYRQAMSLTPEDSPDRIMYLASLGLALGHRYALAGRSEDLEGTILVYRQAVSLTPEDSPDRNRYLASLGVGLGDRYALARRPEDLDEAIQVYRQAASLTPEDSPHRSMYLANLGVALGDRYALARRPEDLEEGIRFQRQAVSLTPEDSPDRAMHLNNLGVGLSDRYALAGRPEDLEEAIQVLQQGVNLTPEDSPDRAAHLNNLGSGLSNRYALAGRPEDLEEAIQVFQQAVNLTPEDSPDRARCLSSLGNGLRDRYALAGRPEDLKDAIRFQRQAVNLTPEDSPDQAMHLNNLGVVLRGHYALAGRPEDLEEAIRVCQQAVSLTPEDSTHRANHSTNLGVALRDRYALARRPEDIEEAIRFQRQAVRLTPEDSTDRATYLNNLGNGLRDRYALAGRPEDLEEAIQVFQQAVNLTPEDSPDRAMYFNNLGNGLRDRYALAGRPEDLEEGIRFQRQAVSLTPKDSTDRAMHLNNLGVGLSDRYALAGRPEDLEEAIQVFQQGVNLTPEDSPGQAMCLNSLGVGLRDRYALAGRPEDLEKATKAFRHACKSGLVSAPIHALRSSRNWGSWALLRNAWAAAGEAFLAGMTAIDALFAQQLARASQESVLAQAQGIAMSAAYALSKQGLHANAVELLERGRARLLGQALEQNRRDLERLPALGHTELHRRYVACINQLAVLRAPGDEVGATTQLDGMNRLDVIDAVRKELDGIIGAIREVPGYSDFFAQPTLAQIQSAAQTGPLVYVGATERGGLALIVHPDNTSGSKPVAEVWLDDLAEWHINDLLYDKPDNEWDHRYLYGAVLGSQHALESTLDWALPFLGRRLVQPVADYLSGHYPQGTMVTLILSGNLGLLPLHAAPVTLDGRTAPLMDFFAVRYAPSATALRHVQTNGDSIVPLRVAGVGNPLPALETAVWAQEKVAELLPALQAIDVERYLPSMPDDQSGDGLPRSKSLIARWQAALAQLAALPSLPPQTVVRQGKVFGELLSLLSQMEGLDVQPVARLLLELASHMSPTSLDAAEAEARSVQNLIGAQRSDLLLTSEATAAALWERLPDATWLHLACHGRFNIGEPLDSALLLAQGTQITLRDLLASGAAASLKHIRLAFLSACQTAISDFRSLPDEVIGLPAAFMQAGIPAVIGTLWPVDDNSTALLVTRFYELLLHGDPDTGLPPQRPVHALRLAQKWLRSIDNASLLAYLKERRNVAKQMAVGANRMSMMLFTNERIRAKSAPAHECPYADPYYWAPFVYFGADLDPVA